MRYNWNAPRPNIACQVRLRAGRPPDVNVRRLNFRHVANANARNGTNKAAKLVTNRSVRKSSIIGSRRVFLDQGVNIDLVEPGSREEMGINHSLKQVHVLQLLTYDFLPKFTAFAGVIRNMVVVGVYQFQAVYLELDLLCTVVVRIFITEWINCEATCYSSSHGLRERGRGVSVQQGLR